MRSKTFPRGSNLLAMAAIASLGLTACDDTPTTAVVQNGFPAAAVTVYKAWWITTLFQDAVAPGESSTVERTVPGSDYAYALLAPGWAPEQGGQPSRLIAVKSAAKLSVSAHDVLNIVVDDATFVGDCAAGEPLDADDASLIVERLFPGPFTGATYDPATCTTSADGAAGGSAGAGGAAGTGGIGGSGD